MSKEKNKDQGGEEKKNSIFWNLNMCMNCGKILEDDEEEKNSKCPQCGHCINCSEN